MPRQKAPYEGDLDTSYGQDLLSRQDSPDRQDPLDHPDPLRAADAAGTESLLRCWTRENDLPRPEDDTLRVDFPATGTVLL
ncbi:iron transporter, partial [Streptomyces sp. SID8455]|nr:iron transporter [Streptomyces sp. SID8455]